MIQPHSARIHPKTADFLNLHLKRFKISFVKLWVFLN